MANMRRICAGSREDTHAHCVFHACPSDHSTKMADRRYQFRANFGGRYIEMRMRRVHLSMRTEGTIRCSGGAKTISVDANLFENGAKQLRFRFENGLVGTGPK